MNKFLATLSFLLFLITGTVNAQSFGGFGSNVQQDQDELPLTQPTPSVDIPQPPMDFGQDSGANFGDDSSGDN